MNANHRQRGQAAVLTVVVATALLGMAALVLDVGSWFRAQRQLQAVADAAALAGAQALPEDAVAARALAADYTTRNGGTSPVITFPASNVVRVSLTANPPGFFSKVFGIDTATVRAKAAARSSNIEAAQWAAPIAVDRAHEMLNGCDGAPCFNEPTQLDLEKVGPGAFRLLNLDGSKGGTGQQILADWIRHGYDGVMKLGQYNSDPGAKFNAQEVQEALEDRFGTEMLFPVYRTIREQGANLEYEVIGWVGFVPSSVKLKGDSGIVFGHFTRVIWAAIQSSSGNADFGVRAIELIE